MNEHKYIEMMLDEYEGRFVEKEQSVKFVLNLF
jgi:hypothetical protein